MTDNVPSGKRLTILRLLRENGELSGSDLLSKDANLPRGTIYTSLKRLQDDQFVTSRLEEEVVQPGPPRRVYKITGLGVRAAKLGDLAEAVMQGSEPVRIPGGRI